MHSYSVIQWLFFFYTYCFLGWCFESVYVSLKKQKFINRGFIRGPFLPLYGSGAIVMLVVSAPYQDNLVLTYISGVIGATLLEYITGVCMEALFKVRYWDYSDKPFNYKGQICLGSSIAWGFLTILMTRVIHEPIAWLMREIPSELLSVATIGVTIYIAVDFSASFRTAMDLRDILVRMEGAKEELQRMQKRLDVIIAVLEDSKAELTESITESLELKKEEFASKKEQFAESELIQMIEEKLGRIKEASLKKSGKYREAILEEVLELKGKFSIQSETSAKRVAGDFQKRNLILGNPTMVSARYNPYLNELKAEIAKRNHRKKGQNKESGEENIKQKEEKI